MNTTVTNNAFAFLPPQQRKVMTYFSTTRRGLTPEQARAILRIAKIRNVVSELRKKGFSIETIPYKTRFRKRTGKTLDASGVRKSSYKGGRKTVMYALEGILARV
jgi:hypothetical protein